MWTAIGLAAVAFVAGTCLSDIIHGHKVRYNAICLVMNLLAAFYCLWQLHGELK